MASPPHRNFLQRFLEPDYPPYPKEPLLWHTWRVSQPVKDIHGLEISGFVLRRWDGLKWAYRTDEQGEEKYLDWKLDAAW